MYRTRTKIPLSTAGACVRGLPATAALAVLALLPACQTGTTPSRGSAEATPGPVRWDMQSVVPSTQPLIGPQAVRFSREIAARSDGEIAIEFLEPGARVASFLVTDAVRGGKIDAGFTSPAFLAGQSPAFGIFAGPPFGLPPRDHYAWLRDGGGLALHDEIYAKAKLKAVPCVMTGPYGFGWFRNPVTTPDDLKGLKMRLVGRVAMRTMERLGVATVAVPAGEVYDLFAGVRVGSVIPDAVAKGLDPDEIIKIDAAALALPYADVRFRLHERVRHYYYPSFYRPFAMFEVMFGLDRWNSLSPERQQLIEDVCHETVLDSIAEDERLAPEALAEIRSRGVAVREVPPAIWEAARQAWADVAAEESRRSRDFRRIYEAYQRYMSARPGG